MANLPQEQRKQRLIQSKPSEKGEIITYLSRMGDVLHDVQERHKFARFGMIVIHAVGDGDKSDIVLAEHHFRIKSCFKIVAPDSAHILRQNHADLSGFHVGNQAFPAGALEVAAAPSVVCIVLAVGEAMLVSIILQIELLRRDLSRCVFARQCTIHIDKQQKERYNNIAIDNDIII